MGRDRPALEAADGLTILLTTHYLEEADRLADQLAIVDRGRIVAEGTPDALKAELQGDALHIELHEIDQAQRALSLVQRLDGVREPVRRSTAARCAFARTRGESAVPVVVSTLEAAGIGVAAVTVSRPSLDDVYLRHTGRAYQHQNGEAHVMTAITHSLYMTQRHTRALLRQPWFMAITLVQPVIWLLLFGIALPQRASASRASPVATRTSTSSCPASWS